MFCATLITDSVTGRASFAFVFQGEEVKDEGVDWKGHGCRGCFHKTCAEVFSFRNTDAGIARFCCEVQGKFA